MPSVEERLAYLEGRVGDQATAPADLRAEMRGLRDEVNGFRNETNTGLASLRNAQDARFAAMDVRFAAADAKLTWVIGIQVGILLMIASAALGAFFK